MTDYESRNARTRKFRTFRPLRKFLKSLGLRRSVPASVRAERGYIICANPRSGSSYFDELLGSTRVLGKPLEYFNYKTRSKFDPAYPEDPKLQLEIVRTRGATPNGIYGLKLLPLHLEIIDGRVDPFRDLPNYQLIRLRRSDLLGQAISLTRAEQTGKFGSRHAPAEPRGYDCGHIRACLQTLFDYDALWQEIIGRLGVQPLELEYEALIQDPQKAVDQVAAFLGVKERARIRWRKVRSIVQRDETSLEWRERFLADTGGEFRHLVDFRSKPPSTPGSASAS